MSKAPHIPPAAYPRQKRWRLYINDPEVVYARGSDRIYKSYASCVTEMVRLRVGNPALPMVIVEETLRFQSAEVDWRVLMRINGGQTARELAAAKTRSLDRMLEEYRQRALGSET